MAGQFIVKLTCCDRNDGVREFDTWAEADAFRESYLSGVGIVLGGRQTGGHDRSAIIVEGPASNEQPRGTHECPICGFDKPHTHERSTIQWFEDAKKDHRYDVASQRRHCRRVAEQQHHMAMVRAEFDANPRGYISKYGTINSTEGGMVVPWLLERLDEDRSLLEKTVEARGREITECHAEIAALRGARDALIAERDRLALDAGISTNLLEEVADGIVIPTRTEIAQRRDDLYEIARRGQSQG